MMASSFRLLGVEWIYIDVLLLLLLYFYLYRYTSVMKVPLEIGGFLFWREWMDGWMDGWMGLTMVGLSIFYLLLISRYYS